MLPSYFSVVSVVVIVIDHCSRTLSSVRPESLLINMSRFGGSTIKCPRCNKSVYDAESVIGGGKAYHQQCFTCATCNTRLSSTTLAERNETLYCSTCYAKAFGPKGFNVGNSSVHTGISVADAPDQHCRFSARSTAASTRCCSSCHFVAASLAQSFSHVRAGVRCR